ncbi:hypothetical protein F4802DRAFT_609862 [Xylaria palmicola]|nr:hypothetical protein F4802DRAFT_609862 [Xylaria palmicola]
MAEKRPRGSEHSDSEQDGSKKRRVRVTRSLGMSDEEWAARERRRARFLLQRQLWDEEQGNTKGADNKTQTTEIETGAGVSESSQPPVAEADSQTRKPWESLVIGNLGENLSRIERKNREIEQQRFIVKYHEEHSPHQVRHNRRILDRLVEERSKMENNEENNMPEDQREEKERMSRRLEALRQALNSSQCEDESINIRAAIQGYESGQIPYSRDFTLIYAGHIVDRCQTYDSFCVDRSERLDHYFAEHGPGWLWHEPPLAGPGNEALAMKALCLERRGNHMYGMGLYPIFLEFAVQRERVSRGKSKKPPRQTGNDKSTKEMKHDASCHLDTVLDSGATFPMIYESDLTWLDIDFTEYPAQGLMSVRSIEGKSSLKFYEMYVSVCTVGGRSLIGLGQEAVWPEEPRRLGGFYPVVAMKEPREGRGDRLSGTMPFDACYMSSAPSTERIWLGEDRRDVLGTNRLPAHLRFDSDKTFTMEYPEDIEELRRTARTPDRVIFLHKFPGKPNMILTDSDSGVRGRSELAIGQYQAVDGSHGEKPSGKVLPQRIIRVEPRKGGVKTELKSDPRPWKWRYEVKKPKNQRVR